MTPEIAELAGLVAAVDAADRACPIRHGGSSLDKCPKCRATSSQPRGKKHDWQLQSVFGETLCRCVRCGLIGDAVSISGPNSTGWSGRPTYGCRALATNPRHQGDEA